LKKRYAVCERCIVWEVDNEGYFVAPSLKCPMDVCLKNTMKRINRIGDENARKRRNQAVKGL
jgi:hypothetical protein